MLKIGNQDYDVCESLTNLSVSINPSAPGFRRQMWRAEVGFLPFPGVLMPWDEAQVWQLYIQPWFLTVSDWRDLAERQWYAGDEPATVLLENLCQSGKMGNHSVLAGNCRPVQRNGTVFTIEFDGEVEPAEGYNGPTGELRGLVEIPFSFIAVSVPANAADPVVAARALAARELGWQGTGRYDWQPYTPEKAGRWPISLHSAHTVWLEVGKVLPPV